MALHDSIRPACDHHRPACLSPRGASPGGGLSQHQNTDDNTLETPFDFTVENYEKVNKILSRYPANYKQSAIILLDLAQRQNGGWLPLAAMNKVAEVVDQAPIRVYEVASFYTMFNRVKVGKYFIQLCGTTPCMACGAEEIASTIQEHLNIKDGETTDDGLFTLKEVECLGACSNAPMVQINDDFYENLTPETTRQLLDACARGGAGHDQVGLASYERPTLLRGPSRQ